MLNRILQILSILFLCGTVFFTVKTCTIQREIDRLAEEANMELAVENTTSMSDVGSARGDGSVTYTYAIYTLLEEIKDDVEEMKKLLKEINERMKNGHN